MERNNDWTDYICGSDVARFRGLAISQAGQKYLRQVSPSFGIMTQTNVIDTIPSMDGKRPTPIIRDVQTLLVRGIDVLERNHVAEAVGLLRQAIHLDAQSFYGHLALGIALTKALDIPAAEEALETAIRLEPKNFYAHLRMAELFHRVGVPTRMKDELQIALDLAETTEQKKIARDLLNSEERRNPRRAWRPDFSKLLGGKRREP